MKLAFTIFLVLFSCMLIAQPGRQSKGYFAITTGFGMNSYQIEKGTLSLNIPYTEFDLTTNTTSNSVFSFANQYSSKKSRSDFMMGMEAVYKKIYYEMKAGGNWGNYKTTCLSSGAGLNLKLIENQLFLRMGAGVFYDWVHSEFGTIDNYQKDITIGGTTFYHSFTRIHRVSSHGNSTTLTYNSDILQVMLKDKFVGLKTNISFVFIPQNQVYLIKFSGGYNFLIYQHATIDMTQYSGPKKAFSSESGKYTDRSIYSSDIDYQFTGNKNIHTPFNMRGLFFNVEFGLIPFRLFGADKIKLSKKYINKMLTGVQEIKCF